MPYFQPLIYRNLDYIDNKETININASKSKAKDILNSSKLSQGEHVKLIIETKDIRGMVMNLLTKYKVESSKDSLKVSTLSPQAQQQTNQLNETTTRARTRSKSPVRDFMRTRSRSPSRGIQKRASDYNLTNSTLPVPPSPSGGSGGGAGGGSGAGSGVDSNNEVVLQVEVIAATSLKNVEAKNKTMSSPFVRCSLLKDYTRHKKKSTYKKYTLLKNVHRMIGTSSSASMNDDENVDEDGSYIALKNKFDKDTNVEYFDTCALRKNLNPRWRQGNEKDYDNKNIGHFQLGDGDYVFWGLALQIDVLSSGNELLGTVTIDLFEWDKSSCDRASLTSWFPLHLQDRSDHAGSIALSIHRKYASEL
eukprot:CAMPEP_0114335944 /NCGR_PEP_ID=MMETSP0101-20121206/5382_1 /TAXON_ID=38822 ORGANISM="Pteridomonas danica, Strain PT" /NCGR_SAMPLE_ID=MMETSP0101 /ASSEMBLY_ACC=CAM_ASM_000211 /LENGTH=362 /DNA_ID=CAMNT_0001467711 /DNA_START=391 /DNA_END=1479 /DNA_ORIENTATION=+